MFKKLHSLCNAATICFALLFTGSVSAQITYSEDFEEADHGWVENTYEFTETLVNPCNGLTSFRGNSYSVFGFDIPISTVSPSLGTANGNAHVLSYNYKLIDYTGAGATGGNWGDFTVEYGASATGPWTLLETVTPQNHTPSVSCALRTLSLTPPAGSSVFLRFVATAQNEADFYLYLDDVTVVAATGCTGTPAANTVQASATAVCVAAPPVTFSLNSVYTNTGLTIQWQSSTDNVTFTNVGSGNQPDYTATVTATTWFRAVVTCTASTLSYITPAVQVVATGLPCYCEAGFANIDAISLVSFGAINNATDPAEENNAAEDFTGLTPATFLRGTAYPIALEGTTDDPFDDGFESYFTVYIDWNHNGILTDAGEEFQIGMVTGTTGDDGIQATGSITVPVTATLGNTFMRVVKNDVEYVDAPCLDDSLNGYYYGQTEDYLINVQAAAGVGSFDKSSFAYYPNPVKDVLNISYISDINGVEVYNLLGQQVLAKIINNNAAQVDMSALAPGTYLVKATAGDAVQSVKVVKQ